MSMFSKIVVGLLIVLSLFYVKEKFLGGLNFDFFKKEKTEKQEYIKPEQKEEVLQPEKKPEKKIEQTISVYYLATDNGGSAVFRKIQRKYEGGSKLESSIKELLEGPNFVEKKAGAYSEIPKGTKLIGIEQQGNNVIINLSSDFQYGGGTDSIYSRMRQLIKTALANSKGKNIYLYLDGKQVDVIGGEGIMVNQPLSESSLDD